MIEVRDNGPGIDEQKLDTEATVSTAVADVKFDVEIDPYVWMLGVAYRF